MRRSYLYDIHQRLYPLWTERRDIYGRSLPKDHSGQALRHSRSLYNPMAAEAAGSPHTQFVGLSYQGMLVKGHLVKAGPVVFWPVKGRCRYGTLKPGARLFPIGWIAGRYDQQASIPFSHSPAIRGINDERDAVRQSDTRHNLKDTAFHRFDAELYPQSST